MYERKNDDGASDTPELKTAIGGLNKAFEDFKKKNDERLKEIEKRGAADAVTEQAVKNLEAEIQKKQDEVSKAQDEQKKRIDLLETALKRPGGDNGKQAEAEAKMAQDFSRMRGREVSVDETKAYRNALSNYLRKNNSGGPVEEIKALSVGSDPDGGYAVTPDMGGQIVKLIRETSPMRQICNVVTIGTDRLKGKFDLADVTSGWVGETQSRAETTSPTLGEWEIPVRELYAEPRATQQILDDAMFNIEEWLAMKVADQMARKENTAFVSGDGILQPKGFLTESKSTSAPSASAFNALEYLATGTQASYGSTTNGGDKLTELVYKLKSPLRQGASFLMSRTTLAITRKLKDGQGNYLWQPDFSSQNTGLLLGFPVIEAADMPEITASTDTYSVAFGNFKEGYTIVDRAGIRVLRDSFTAKPYVKFYTTKRVGGAVTNFEAIKLLKFAAS